MITVGRVGGGGEMGVNSHLPPNKNQFSIRDISPKLSIDVLLGFLGSSCHLYSCSRGLACPPPAPLHQLGVVDCNEGLHVRAGGVTVLHLLVIEQVVLLLQGGLNHITFLLLVFLPAPSSCSLSWFLYTSFSS